MWPKLQEHVFFSDTVFPITDDADESHLIRWTKTRTKRLATIQKKQLSLRSRYVADWSAWADAHERPRRWLHLSIVPPVFVVVRLCEGIWHCRPLTVSVWTLRREILCSVALCIYTHMDTHRNIHNAFGIFTLRRLSPFYYYYDYFWFLFLLNCL